MHWIKLNGRFINLETVELIEVTSATVNFILISGTRSVPMDAEVRRFLKVMRDSHVHEIFGEENNGTAHHPVIRRIPIQDDR